ncbi:MAG: hypothetical protein IT440_05960 [Phycisphaeraceae bacterium]|nr:hypothetical protein [Phycisphaeraceae bacterium]
MSRMKCSAMRRSKGMVHARLLILLAVAAGGFLLVLTWPSRPEPVTVIAGPDRSQPVKCPHCGKQSPLQDFSAGDLPATLKCPHCQKQMPSGLLLMQLQGNARTSTP